MTLSSSHPWHEVPIDGKRFSSKRRGVIICRTFDYCCHGVISMPDGTGVYCIKAPVRLCYECGSVCLVGFQVPWYTVRLNH